MVSNTSAVFDMLTSCTSTLHTKHPVLASLFFGSSAPLKGQLGPLPSTSSLLPGNARVVFVSILLLSIPFVFNYLVIWLFFHVSQWSKKAGKVPPTVPYLVPFLGSTISYLWNPLKFVGSSTYHFGRQNPVNVKLLTSNLYLLQGADNITTLWKHSSVSTATAIHSFCLTHFFGMPKKAVDIYTLDDSGSFHQPYPDSKVKPNNRVDYHTNQSLLRFLGGPGLAPFFERFVTGLSKRLYSLNIEDEWTELPDFLEFFQLEMTPVVIEAVCGPVIMCHNPDFARDFWKYNLWVSALSKGLPRFMIPEAYRIRDKILIDIKQWHAYARTHFDKSKIGPDGDADPYWGSEFIRARQDMFLSMDDFDYDALASSDFGAIWAINTNAILSTFWSNLELFRDPALLSRVRHELKASLDSSPQANLRFDIEKLVKQPLLQSVYAETLRLRVHVYTTRCPERKNLEIKGWSFPRNKIVLVSSTPAHMDENAWNTGRDGSQSLDRFWAERFLVYPDDPYSGPQKKTFASSPHTENSAPAAATKAEEEKRNNNEPQFSLHGMIGSWIPYGGGSRACPGRHFAKRAIMTTCAMMVSMYDVEIVAGEKALQMNPADYGLGVLRPVDKVPFRIRRRNS
ncbi:MAG: hypothetical protein M1830_006662 [Pleopsidium flavum]|nr:MAG: hypothetical protein M1830_006671 [Pleopsidium flavum]KAI9876368.1 MAG: hypothetical protein M1830_006662 [Pleopsidium flavum]